LHVYIISLCGEKSVHVHVKKWTWPVLVLESSIMTNKLYRVYFNSDKLKYVSCSAGKIHISEATKSALDNNSDRAFDVELRGEIDVKVRYRKPQVNCR